MSNTSASVLGMLRPIYLDRITRWRSLFAATRFSTSSCSASIPFRPLIKLMGNKDNPGA